MLKSDTQIKAVVFDLGGVLVDLKGMQSLIPKCPLVETEPELHAQWTQCRAVRAFETGEIDFDTFCRATVEELALNMEADEFSTVFASFIGDINPGIPAVLDAIPPGIWMGCLSNTNPIHYALLSEKTCILERFNPCCLSFQTGYMKPDRTAYLDLCEQLGLPPAAILFLDDNPGNVTAARNCGIQAAVTRDIETIWSVLSDYSVIEQSK